MTEEKQPKYTNEELRAKYLENCKEKRTWPFAHETCWSCGLELYQYHADAIMDGYADITGCPKCYRTFCD